MLNTKALFSSAKPDWETPPDLFRSLDEEFHFTLDAASSDANALCARHYTLEDDGLTQPWTGAVWCNPPYGREVGKWVKKGSDAAASGEATVVMLLPARTDTRWFHDYIYNKAEVRFLRGRLKFSGSSVSAPFPSMLAIFRSN